LIGHTDSSVILTTQEVKIDRNPVEDESWKKKKRTNHETLSEKITKAKRAWGVARVKTGGAPA
jgi:hypothetical protein